MDEKTSSGESHLASGIKARLIAGLVVLLPIALTALILQLVILGITDLLEPLVEKVVPGLEPWQSVLISCVLFVAILYVVGLLTTLFIGRRIISFGEAIILRIPLVKVIYGAIRQMMQTLSATQRDAFQKVVLIQHPHPGMRAIGFVTGEVIDVAGRDCYTIFVPTTPNPTNGFLQIVPRTEVEETRLTVEDGVKTVISAGILAPPELGGEPPSVGEGRTTANERE